MNYQKHIAFFISSMDGGGAQKVTLLLANELVQRGYKVDLVLVNRIGPFLKKIDRRVNIIELKYKSSKMNVFQIIKYLNNVNPGIFFSSMTYLNIVALTAYLFSNYTGQIIISEHTNLVKAKQNNKNFTILGIIYLAKLLYRQSHNIICVSKGVAESLEKIIGEGINPVVIYNPIELYRGTVIQNESKNNPFKVISAGRLTKYKNYKLLLEAYKIVKEKKPSKSIQLQILGEGHKRKELEKFVYDNGLSDSVSLPGFITDIYDEFKKADLFVLSSRLEGFGNVIVEALSCGLPVISTNCPSGPAEILEDGKIGKLVPVGDKSALAEAIIEHIEVPNRYSTPEERIERSKDFAVEKIVDEYEKIFKVFKSKKRWLIDV